MSHIPVDFGFDPRIADWLEADPVHAPRTVLDTVLAAVPSIPQRRAARVLRRLPAMNRLTLVGAAAALAAAVGLGVFALKPPSQSGGNAEASRSAGPSSSPYASEGPSASPSGAAIGALTQSFVSTRNRYTLRYPDGWIPTPASADWLPGRETLWGDPALDVLQGARARFVAASQPLAAGQTAEQWYVAYCELPHSPKAVCAEYATTWKPISIGPATGYVDIDGASALAPSINPGGPMFDAVVVVDDRGYEFTLDGVVDRGLFERLLAAVEFGPAFDLSSSFTSPWYGYRVAYPTGWAVTSGTGPWPLGENLSHGNPHLDQIISPPGYQQMRLAGASIALPGGMTMDGFRAFASPAGTRCNPLVAPLPEPVLIDGVQALVSLNGCHSLSTLGGTIYDLLVISGGRGYDFTLDGHLNAADSLAWLGAIRLEPDTAPVDTSPPPSRAP